jgi:MoaA/NifB/PqqE/SkfB family radical SAM enzyme
MAFYTPQSLYRKVGNHHLRLAAIKAVKTLGRRYMLVRVDTNDACNLRCVMCYFSDPDRKPAAPPMSEEMFATMARQLLPKTRYLYMSCGTEPFVTAHFDRLLDVVGSYRVPFVSYCTNGLLMRDKFIDATLRNRVSEVIFSVDGGTRETYEKIRVGASWDKFNQRLQAFHDARARHAGPKPVTRFNFTVQEQNCDELATFMEWVAQWQPQTVQLRLFRSLDGAVKQHDDERTLAVFEAALPQLRRIAKAAGIRLLAMNTPEERRKQVGAAISPFSVVDPAPERLAQVNCQLPWFNLYITANGDVHPCTVHEPVGNFTRQDFAEIERGEAMAELRRSLRREPREVCVNCQLTGASGV